MEIYRNPFKLDFASIKERPLLGVAKKELGDNIFSLVSISLLIIYHFQDADIKLLRILHGSRDIPNHIKI